VRELTVKLRFVSPCLGQVKKYNRQRGKAQYYYVLPRDPISGKVVFQPHWWHAILLQAAEILCRYQQDVPKVRFMMEVSGEPQPIPERYFHRHDGPHVSRHEAFFPGDVIDLNCVVPSTIPDEDFKQLMIYAGRYYGISPAHPRQFGFFEVVSINKTEGAVKDGESKDITGEST
jgi:hypothetical protein